MLFNSVPFLLFFPTVCVLYYCIPARRCGVRNLLLLVASYYFYMSWRPAYALLLFASTAATYFAALGMACLGGRWRKACLVACVVVNLGLLFFFKYWNFLGANVTVLLHGLGIGMSVPLSGLLLPVGISFYTFQAMGYAIDVYRGTTPAERHFSTYALFVSFFPQLVAGPIERSARLLPQFRSRRGFSYVGAMAGVRMMVWGYFLKLVLADRCGLYVDNVLDDMVHNNGGSYLVASLLFPFQVYGDFAGYSLIAIGAARILGFRLVTNFRSPYLSRSVGEFWHRWHISLSTWFRDYVYIPLGGNRRGRLRTYANLMLTFVVSGLWHGANWTFVVWGALHGVFLCAEKFLGVGRHERCGLCGVVRCVVTFVLVSFAWIFFRAATLSDAFAVITGIATAYATPYLRVSDFLIIGLCLLMLLVDGLVREGHVRATCLSRRRLCRPSFLSHLAIASVIAVIILFGILDSGQFIYFQF